MTGTDDELIRNLRDLAVDITPPARTEVLLQRAQQHARTQQRLRAVGAAAAVVALVATVTVTMARRDETANVPIAPTPTVTADPRTPVKVVQTLRLDGERLLLVTAAAAGSQRRYELLDWDGNRRQLGTLADPPDYPGAAGYPTQALVIGRSWYVLTNDCAGAGLRLYRSDDSGRTWSRGLPIGAVNCSAGSVAYLSVTAAGLALVTKNDNGPGTQIRLSSDGQHWPAEAQRTDHAASTVAFQDNGSYVRIVGQAEQPGQTIMHATSVSAPEQATSLPEGADPLNATLVRAGSGYAVIASNGRVYTSVDGRLWTPAEQPFPGCACTHRHLTALDGSVWWADAQEGHVGHYAVTLDAGRTWHAVPAPPGENRQTSPSFTPWTATTAVVQSAEDAQLTKDSGRHWSSLNTKAASPTPAKTTSALDPPAGLAGITCGRDGTGQITRYHPTEVAVACGDNGIRASQLDWDDWTVESAHAHGIYVQNDCEPTCAQGHLRQYPRASFEFRGPLLNGDFSTLLITVPRGATGPNGRRSLILQL